MSKATNTLGRNASSAADRRVKFARARFATAVAMAHAIAATSPCTALASEPSIAECLASSERAVSLRHGHQLLAARAALVVCSSATCPMDVRDECVRVASAVIAATPTITFETKDELGNDVAGCKITMDGRALDTVDGVALEIDPGPHAFVFSAPGFQAAERRFVLVEREKDRLERVVLHTVPPLEVPTPASLRPLGHAPDLPPARGLPPRRTAGWILGAFGLSAASVGATFLAFDQTFASRSDREDRAVAGSGHADHVTAVHDEITGFALVGVGTALVGAAIYLVVWSSSAPRTAPTPAAAWLDPLQWHFNVGGGF